MADQAVTEMFERTERCRYTTVCDSFQTMVRAENWMERTLSKLRISAGDFDDIQTMESLQWRLAHIRQVKERCNGYNGRCLRFWQFKAREENDPRFLRRKAEIFPSRIYEDLMEEIEGNA